jgi:hypothetical protein
MSSPKNSSNRETEVFR